MTDGHHEEPRYWIERVEAGLIVCGPPGGIAHAGPGTLEQIEEWVGDVEAIGYHTAPALRAALERWKTECAMDGFGYV